MLKERIRVVCCLCYARGEHPERKVVKTGKVTTRGHEGSPQVHSMCWCRKRDPQPESQETPKSPSSSSLVGSRFTGNSALGRLVLPSFPYLRFRRSSHYGRGGPGARGTGG